MIGTILSMHFYGKEGWGRSIVFWIAVLVLGGMAAALVGSIYMAAAAVVSAAAWILLCHYWYKKPWERAITLFIISIIIDIVIVVVLFAIIFAAIGISGFDWITDLFPAGQLLG